MHNIMEQSQVLLQSCVGERIWALYEVDKQAFKSEVTEYFAKAYPNYKVKKASYNDRVIWLAKGE